MQPLYVIEYVCQELIYEPFGKNKAIFIVFVITSWLILSAEWEVNCSIGMVDGLIFLIYQV